MIFVDTNYFLRYFLNDLPDQSQEAKKLFLAAAGRKVSLLTSSLVIFEFFWVLRSFYNLDKEDTIHALRNVLKLSFVFLHDREILQKALSLFEKSNLELEDCYNLYFAKNQKVESFITFDKKLEKEFVK